MPPTLAVATCAALPDLDEDGPALRAALTGAGLEHEVVAWDAGVDWARFDAVLIRTTWDYTERPAEFLAWTRRPRLLLNDADTVAWNADKVYLRDLADAGVATVPTRYVAPRQELVGWGPDQVPTDPLDEIDWPEIVVKPTISASSRDTGRFVRDDPAARELLERILARGRAAMIQPYLRCVDTEGEGSLVFIDGTYSHCARKAPILSRRQGGVHGDSRRPGPGAARDEAQPADAQPDEAQPDEAGPDEAGPDDARVRSEEPRPGERELAERVLEVVTRRFGTPLFARIDLLPTPDGPVLLEAELIEPSLWLAAPGAAERLARAIRGRLAQPVPGAPHRR